MSPQPTPPSPTVIPAEGVAQVFADEGCTQYYDGSETDRVYVRVNRDFGMNDSVDQQSGADNESFAILGPVTEFPDDPFGVVVYVDFHSEELGSSIDAGTVIACNAQSPQSVSDPVTVFYES